MQSRINVSRRAIFLALSTTVLGTIAQTGMAAQGLPSHMDLVTGLSLAPSMRWTSSIAGNNVSVGEDVGGVVAGRGGSGDAARSWTNAAGGAWATAPNWNPAQVPGTADDATFALASTYAITLPTGAVARSVVASAGNVTFSGGSLALTNPENPGVGVPATTPFASLHATGSSQITIGGGAQVTYTQAYAGNSLTDTAKLNVTGAGTLLTVNPSLYAANGRLGTLRGNTEFNVTAGARAEARLFEIGRQDGNYTSTFNIDGGHLGAVTAATVDATTEPQISFRGTGSANSLNLNVTNGGTIDASRIFSGSASTVGQTANLTVSGAGSSARFNSYVITNGGSTVGNPAVAVPDYGTTNINVTNGGMLSAGFYNFNQNGAAGGNAAATTTNILVDGVGSILEAKDSNDFQNSYFILGTDVNTTTTMTVRNGAIARALTTDIANGLGFITVSGDRGTVATLNIETGGTVTVADQFAVASSDFATGSTGATGTVNISGGGKLIATGVTGSAGSGFFAVDRDDTATITVSGVGSEVSLPGGAISFGGGNIGDDLNFVPGGGVTNATINSGGVVSASRLILARDHGIVEGTGARTTITIDGAGSALKAVGADTDPTDNTLDNGVITTTVAILDALELPIEGTGDGDFTTINVTVSNGGLLDAEEAALLGDQLNGSSTYTITGAGSTFDAGRQLSINTDGLMNSVFTLNIADGGVVRTSSSTTQETGSIFVGVGAPEAAAGTTATTITLTGAGSTLQSSANILLGGVFNATNVESLGTPVTLTAGAGTSLIAGASLQLASNSTISTAGTVAITGVSTIGGTWTISGGNDVFVGTLNAVNEGQFKVTNTNGATPTLLKTDNVLIASTAKVDLGMNAMRIRPESVDPTTLADVKAYLALGRVTVGAGGITSTVLTAGQAIGYDLVTAAGTFLGSPVLAGDILVRATFKGDTDLSGAVNFDDLLALAQKYGTTGTGEWFDGDSNFDGNVNFDDLLALAQNYNSVLSANGSIVTGDSFVTDSFAGDWALALSLAPEPTSLAALGMASALIGRRRR